MPFNSIDGPPGFEPARPISVLGCVGIALGVAGLGLGCIPVVGFWVGLPLAILGVCLAGFGLVAALASGEAGWGLPAFGVVFNLGVVGIVYQLTEMAMGQMD